MQDVLKGRGSAAAAVLRNVLELDDELFVWGGTERLVNLDLEALALRKELTKTDKQSLEEERAATSGDIREVYAEAKSAGYDTKVMRQIVRLRKMDSADRQEQQALLDVYMRAVGLG